MTRIHFFHHDNPPPTCEFPITAIKPSSSYCADSSRRSLLSRRSLARRPPSARGIHQRAEIRSDLKEGKIKNGGDAVSAIIEGKNYELIRRNESRYCRGDGLRRVDRGRDGSRVAKAEPVENRRPSL